MGRNNMKIGVLDSGIGGLTVLQRALSVLPEEKYLYYADTDHVPYGTKKKDEIIQYVDYAAEFLIRQGAAAILIACNTATSAAIEYIRGKYEVPVLGMEPAVKLAVEKYPKKRVLVTATPLTIREEKLQHLINQVGKNQRIDLLPLPGLVTLAEANRFETDEAYVYLSGELSACRPEDYSTIVLGCTHFNYFKDTLRRIFPAEAEFIDGIGGTVRHLRDVLDKTGLLGRDTPGITFYESGRLINDAGRLEFYASLIKRAKRMTWY